MNVVDFAALTLAASAIVDVWRNGSIFEKARAYTEAKADLGITDDSLPAVDNPYRGGQESLDWAAAQRSHSRGIIGFFCELINCHFCLSHHTPWILALLCYFPSLFVVQPWDFLFKLPIYSLAATRLSTILDAIVPQDAKYNREDVFEQEFIYGETTPTTEPDASEPGDSSGSIL
jgi:hypothetical protein